MDNFINVKAKIIDKKYFNSKMISLVYEIENISNNSYQDLYFYFNIKKYGKIKRIILEENKKYTSYTSSDVYISNIHSEENRYFGIIVSLNDNNEKICPIELMIAFNDCFGKIHKKRIIKYLKNEDNYEKNQEDILFLDASKEYANYKDIIKYKILLINNIYKNIRKLVIPINIPNNTKYVEDSLIIDGIKKEGCITSIQVRSLEVNECVCIEYSVEINSVSANGDIVNNISILFIDDNGNHTNMEKVIATKVKDSRIKIENMFKEIEDGRYKVLKKIYNVGNTKITDIKLDNILTNLQYIIKDTIVINSKINYKIGDKMPILYPFQIMTIEYNTTYVEDIE